MRVTYRARNIKDYWAARWGEIESDLPMTNVEAYPLKYALETVSGKQGKILEAGCGAGRILRYFHDNGYPIVGIDYIDVAIEKLMVVDPSLDVSVGDITDLKFPDDSFTSILSFGLYHNLENGLEKAVQETYRVLENGGSVCASFRADNIQTKIQDWLTLRATVKTKSSNTKFFHKINLTKKESSALFTAVGFKIKASYPVENMPFLYKFRFFRTKTHKVFDESKGRVEGYQLSWLGRRIQKFLMNHFADYFCNIYVIVAEK